MTAFETARDYIALGWSPVPVPHKSKAPLDRGWPDKVVTKETAHRYFNGEDQNIGVRLGELSGGLADTDLDCAEAIDAAPAFLPRTVTFGRASKRFSHWLYKTDLAATEAAATIKFMDVQKPARPILEIRIGGGGKAAQTVFPGSVHPSGEAIEWDDRRSEVATIEGAELKRLCARLSACVLIARAYPQQGGRHDGALVVAGFLCRCGFTGPDIKLFVDTLAGVTCQPPDKRRDMVRAAVDTAEAFAAGRNTFGLPKMIEVFGEPVAKKCAEWLGHRATPIGHKTTLEGEAKGFYEVVAPENSEIDLALRFVAEHHKNFRHVAEWGKWLEWNGDFWKTETTLKVWHLAKLICLAAANTAPPAEANRIARANTIAAVERISKADRIVAAKKDQWDLDEFLINAKKEQP